MNEKEYQKLMKESDRCETVALKMKDVNLKTFYHNASVGFKNKALALDLYTVDNTTCNDTTYNNTTCNDYSNTSVVDNHLSATTKFIAELLLGVLIISTLMITSIL